MTFLTTEDQIAYLDRRIDKLERDIETLRTSNTQLTAKLATLTPKRGRPAAIAAGGANEDGEGGGRVQNPNPAP